MPPPCAPATPAAAFGGAGAWVVKYSAGAFARGFAAEGLQNVMPLIISKSQWVPTTWAPDWRAAALPS